MALEKELTSTYKRRRPLNHFDDLRSCPRRALQDEPSQGTQSAELASSILSIEEDNIRLGHLVSLLMISNTAADGEDGKRAVRRGSLDVEIAAFLALHHFNERSGAVIPDLPNRIGDCNLYFTMDFRDSYGTARQSTRQFLEAVNVGSESQQSYPLPTGIVGTGRSITSFPSSILGGVFQIPQVSCCATARELSGVNSPTFARTVPTNRADAEAVAEYFLSKGIAHVAVLHIAGKYGQGYATDFRAAAEKRGISVVVSEFASGNEVSLRKAIRRTEQSLFRYIFGIFGQDEIRNVMNVANEAGLVGQPYTWIFGEDMNRLLGDSISFDKVEDEATVKALDGSGVILFHVPANQRFNAAIDDFRSDPELQEYFKSLHPSPELWDEFDLSQGYSLQSIYFALLNYDATIALALSSCQTEMEDPTGPAILDTLLDLSFDGSSGPVRFDNITRSRSYAGLQFKVYNIVAQDPTDDGLVFLSSRETDTIDFINEEQVIVEEKSQFFFASSDNVRPPAIPPPEVDLNLISDGLLAFGLIICVLMVLMSLAWICWVVYFRKKHAVRSAQPLFLVMLCVGTIIMATAIIPMGFQEPLPQHILDGACTCTPWLLSIGFTTSLSALFSKIWRIDRVYRASVAFQRIEVKPQDVLLPFAILMSVNIGLLIAWTVASPLKWSRDFLEDSLDAFERPISSIGKCKSDQGSSGFSWALAGINFVSLLCAVIQSYRSRKLPSVFNESTYVAISLASMLEASIIGFPLLWLVADQPAANYVLRAIMVTIFCCAILLPIFVPKAKIHFKKNRRNVRYTGPASAAAAEASANFMSDYSNRQDIGQMSFRVVDD